MTQFQSTWPSPCFPQVFGSSCNFDLGPTHCKCAGPDPSDREVVRDGSHREVTWGALGLRISRSGKSQWHFCHCALRRNGIVSYRNDAISGRDWQRAGGFRTRNPPHARWRSWPGIWAVFANPANPWLGLGITRTSIGQFVLATHWSGTPSMNPKRFSKLQATAV